MARAQATSASCAPATAERQLARGVLGPEPRGDGDLVVARAPGMHLAPERPELLAETALEVGVHVLVGRVVRHRGHLRERLDERVRLGGLQETGALEHAHVHLRGEHVVGEQRAIDGQRARERKDVRVELRPDPARPQRARGVGQLGAPALCI